MNWVRIIVGLVAGAAGGGLIAWWQLREPKVPQETLRTESAGFWVRMAIHRLGNASSLSPFTTEVIVRLKPNQGRYLDRRTFAPITGTNGEIRVPSSIRLVDESHSGAFLFRDKNGDYILFTHGELLPSGEPEKDAHCVTAKLYVCPSE